MAPDSSVQLATLGSTNETCPAAPNPVDNSEKNRIASRRNSAVLSCLRGTRSPPTITYQIARNQLMLKWIISRDVEVGRRPTIAAVRSGEGVWARLNVVSPGATRPATKPARHSLSLNSLINNIGLTLSRLTPTYVHVIKYGWKHRHVHLILKPPLHLHSFAKLRYIQRKFQKPVSCHKLVKKAWYMLKAVTLKLVCTLGAFKNFDKAAEVLKILLLCSNIQIPVIIVNTIFLSVNIWYWLSTRVN